MSMELPKGFRKLNQWKKKPYTIIEAVNKQGIYLFYFGYRDKLPTYVEQIKSF